MESSPSDDFSAAEQKAARRARLLINLDAALGLASKLNAAVTTAFPEASAAVDQKLSLEHAPLTVAQKLALGDEAARELSELAFSLDPDGVMDSLESELLGDTFSQRAASLAVMKAQGASQ